MAQEREIKYINREFSDFKDQLIVHAKNYFPDTYNDFSPTSPGTMFIEMAAYVGDVLSFYQDTQLQETYLQYAKDPGNLYSLAYMMGYRPKVSTVAEVELRVSHTVPADSNFNPDYSKALIVASNAVLGASVSAEVDFIVDEKIDFSVSSSYNPTEVTISSIDNDVVPYLLKLKRTSRRFTARFNSTGQLLIQFGAGITGQEDTAFLPDPTNVGLGTNQGLSRIDYNYDPNNFLYSSAYGVAPSNTTLTIEYLIGGGVEANVPTNTIVNQKSVSVTGDSDIVSTLKFNNLVPSTGGRDGDSVEELRENSRRSFAEQGRAVTLQDYSFRALTLPSKFGSIAKAYVTQDQLVSSNSYTDNIIDSNPLSLSMYVLAYNNSKHVVNATNNLKKNLQNYLSQYKMITDAINIKDAFVINIEVSYEIILRPNYSGRDVLLQCTNEIKDFFEISKWSINQPINLSLIYTLLDRVKGVQTVEDIKVTNKQGGLYSRFAYDVEGATKRNVVYPSKDPMIFELKYPNNDIKGRITTL